MVDKKKAWEISAFYYNHCWGAMGDMNLCLDGEKNNLYPLVI